MILQRIKEVVYLQVAESVNERLNTLSINIIDGAEVTLKENTKYKITIEEV